MAQILTRVELCNATGLSDGRPLAMICSCGWRANKTKLDGYLRPDTIMNGVSLNYCSCPNPVIVVLEG